MTIQDAMYTVTNEDGQTLYVAFKKEEIIEYFSNFDNVAKHLAQIYGDVDSFLYENYSIPEEYFNTFRRTSVETSEDIFGNTELTVLLHGQMRIEEVVIVDIFTVEEVNVIT
jgi:uncharacterized protein Yka (UPF0111/DUF47 family)